MPQIDVMKCSDDNLRAIISSLMAKESANASKVDALLQLKRGDSDDFLEKLRNLES